MAMSSWKLASANVKVSHKASAITISFTEEELASYDLEGRLLGIYEFGANVRRGLDNSFQKRWREDAIPARDLKQAALSRDESWELTERYRELTQKLLSDHGAARQWPETKVILERITGHTYQRLEESAARFRAVYGHIPILPPDQYRSLVVQATDGCPYNKCTFCTLYRDKEYMVRSPEQFSAHIKEVLNFMGAGLSYRNAIFLGDANALAISIGRLTGLLEILRSTREIRPLLDKGGVNAFLDIYTGIRKSVEDYRALGALGLKRVALGVESGSEALLDFVNKPGKRDDIMWLVDTLKAAGLEVIVIFMVGLGGHTYRRDHLEDSATLVKQLALSKGDIIYLSQFAPSTEAPYLRVAKAAHVKPLSHDEIVDETMAWKARLAQELGGKGVKVVPYSFQRFIY